MPTIEDGRSYESKHNSPYVCVVVWYLLMYGSREEIARCRLDGDWSSTREAEISVRSSLPQASRMRKTSSLASPDQSDDQRNETTKIQFSGCYATKLFIHPKRIQ
jgi:hypothetical protein